MQSLPIFSTKFTATVSLLALALTSASQTLAAPSQDQWQAYNQAAINELIVPGYQQLTQALQTSQTQVNALCETTKLTKPARQAKLEAAQLAYKQAMDKWQAVQHIQYGPVTLLMRNYGL